MDGNGVILRPTSSIWMALAGLVVLGIASILVATASAPITATILRPGTMALEATLTQIILVVLVCSILGFSLGGGSRVAFVLTLGIGVAAIGWWIVLVTGGHPAAFDRLPVIVAAAGLLVVTGLLLELSAFWSHDAGDPEPDEPVSPRHGADPWWRPPR